MKAGFVQCYPEFGNVQANLDRVEKLIERKRADLFVLPELFSTGYRFGNMEESYYNAEKVPDGLTTSFLCSLAKIMDSYFIAGLVETDTEQIYNSSVVVGPEGLVGRYRKIHLFGTEKVCFHTGSEAPPVFDLRGAKVGVMICFDWRFLACPAITKKEEDVDEVQSLGLFTKSSSSADEEHCAATWALSSGSRTI